MGGKKPPPRWWLESSKPFLLKCFPFFRWQILLYTSRLDHGFLPPEASWLVRVEDVKSMRFPRCFWLRFWLAGVWVGNCQKVVYIVNFIDFGSGSTISTLLHDKINPKDCQILSLGDSGFLHFGVVSSDYGKPRGWWMILPSWILKLIFILLNPEKKTSTSW